MKLTIWILKNKSGVIMIVDFSRDYTVVNGVWYFLPIFPFNLRNFIFQSAMKCEMTSFNMTSLHVDLNEAAKQNGDDIWPNLFLINYSVYESWRHQNLERTHALCSAVGGTLNVFQVL